MSTEQTTPEDLKTPLWKNPYLIGFLVGAVGLIAIRPIQEAVKHAPPPLVDPVEWSLTDHNGDAFGSAQLEGKPFVADFFFTRCPSICPELTRKMIELKKRIDKHPELMFVSFSVDPENDTPDVLRAYREKFKIDDERWRFVTGDRDAVHKLFTEGFKLHVGERAAFEDPSETVQGDLYDIAHTQNFILFDQRGALRAQVVPDSHGLARLSDAVKLLVERGPDA